MPLPFLGVSSLMTCHALGRGFFLASARCPLTLTRQMRQVGLSQRPYQTTQGALQGGKARPNLNLRLVEI
jgi:hypothetical protein